MQHCSAVSLPQTAPAYDRSPAQVPRYSTVACPLLPVHCRYNCTRQWYIVHLIDVPVLNCKSAKYINQAILVKSTNHELLFIAPVCTSVYQCHDASDMVRQCTDYYWLSPFKSTSVATPPTLHPPMGTFCLWLARSLALLARDQPSLSKQSQQSLGKPGGFTSFSLLKTSIICIVCTMF